MNFATTLLIAFSMSICVWKDALEGDALWETPYLYTSKHASNHLPLAIFPAFYCIRWAKFAQSGGPAFRLCSAK
jgi:hypothetical protein